MAGPLLLQEMQKTASDGAEVPSWSALTDDLPVSVAVNGCFIYGSVMASAANSTASTLFHGARR